MSMPEWDHFEGDVVAGQFPLERRVGGAVFLTQAAPGRAVIELRPAGEAEAARLVERWNRAAKLRHPHVAGILAAGSAAVRGVPLAYVVTEYAEESLAEVLGERPLTTDEAREMLLPVANALAYLHGQGLVHGDVKPANILAVGETVKLSADGVAAGDPAEDIRKLGATVVEAFTQRADAGVDALPMPFREIARNCLDGDPRRQWRAEQVAAALRPPALPAPIPARAPARRRSYVAAGVAVVIGVAIVGGLAMRRTAGPAPPAASEPTAERVAEPPRVVPAAPVAPAPVPEVATRGRADRVAEPARDGITRRVLPEIPAKARATVSGTARVAVRVTVDAAGSVTEARLEPGGSAYFGRLAVGAAQRWQFVPAEGEGARHWMLRFGITQSGTRAEARRAK